MTDPEDDLADRVAELESTIEELRGELRRPPRGPFGLPRPPRPSEVLRFADEYGIPAAIAVLEANVRMLELLQGVLRATRGVRDSERTRSRAADVGRESLRQLDVALSELSSAIEGSGLPQEPESRRLLQEARSLGREVRGRLEAELEEESGVDGEGETPIGVEEEDALDVDVESELQSIKDELSGELDDAEELSNGSAGDADDDVADQST